MVMLIDLRTISTNLLIVKLLINSSVSTPGANVLGLDLKVIFLSQHPHIFPRVPTRENRKFSRRYDCPG